MPRFPALRVPGRKISQVLLPNQKLRWRRTGGLYFVVWIALLAVGLHQQANLILLIAGMAAGPIVASFFVSAAMLHKVRVTRRPPPYAFAGDPLVIDYILENLRRSTAVLALGIEDAMTPTDRAIPGASPVLPRVTFDRVGPRERGRLRWQGPSPNRGRYQFGPMEMVTGSPFGLIERRVVLTDSDEILIYPRIGRLSRRWNQIHRESTQTKKGRRHDRTAQQQEYHGLREYRPGDSPRWIHWRTTARVGKPMVKEFEQQNDQDIAILVDPWLPRTKITAEQREAIESALRFTATVCVDLCRQSGQRLLLGWTGPTPSVRQGLGSAKLLHEFLGQLAVMRSASEGHLSGLLDALPPSTLRESLLVIVTTRPINLGEELERSARTDGGAARGISGRVLLLNSSKGDLDDLIRFDGAPSLISRRAEDGTRAQEA